MRQLMGDFDAVTPFDDHETKQPSTNRVRWFHSLIDLLGRIINNRLSVTTSGDYSTASAPFLSSGYGTSGQRFKRYGEAFLTGCVALTNSNATYVYCRIYRTIGNVPASNNAPAAGDVQVGPCELGGPVTTVGNASDFSFAMFDTGLDPNVIYKYYLAITARDGGTSKLEAGSILQVSEF